MDIFKKLPLEKRAFLVTVFQNCTVEVRYSVRHRRQLPADEDRYRGLPQRLFKNASSSINKIYHELRREQTHVYWKESHPCRCL